MARRVARVRRRLPGCRLPRHSELARFPTNALPSFARSAAIGESVPSLCSCFRRHRASARKPSDASGRFARRTRASTSAPCLDLNGNLDLESNQEIANRLTLGLRAAGANTRIGLDPEVFAIDTKLRPTPFPGLESFGDEDADAALFYGRSGEIAHALEELRKMRAERDQRAFVILGASGAGKSSLLKAGIIPHLRREVPAWLPLRAFRPGADPLLNFAEALSKTLADFGKVEAHGIIRDRLSHVWSKADRGGNGELTAAGLKSLEQALEAEGHKLREAANRMSASILISVDQAEEIARAESESAEALADFLRVASLSTDTSWLLAFTVRTDSFHELQSHRRFQHLEARPLDLRTVRIFRLESIVEEPAKRYKVRVDHDLVDALMEDAPKEDALPLLAFALQRLWQQYAASGALTRDNYERIGGLKALIEDAAERALRGLDADPPLPSAPPSKRVIDLGAATFVPPLAQVNEQGATIRRIATWASFDDEQQELLLRFDRWRLVIRKAKEEAGGGTVEVAHEALFREWTRLKSWLEPERARLDALRALEIDALTWNRNGRDAAFLTHREKRLAEANALVGNEGYRKRDYRGTPPTDGSAWTEGGDASRRVVRGGSWTTAPQDLRSANRGRDTSDDRINNLGFRVGRTLTP